MSSTLTVWPSPRSGWITPYDAFRSYLLPPNVVTNIPRRGYLGSIGAHDWARGLLIELQWRLGGTALSVHYRELLTRHAHDDPSRIAAHLPVGNEVTARLRTDDGLLVSVTTREEWAPFGPQGDRCTVVVNGEIPSNTECPQLNGTQTHPPTLPWLAFLVQQHLHTRAPASRNAATADHRERA